MVSVEAVADKNRGYTMTLDGHAGTREICAAVSAITVALQGWCESALKPGERKTEVTDGAARIWWRMGREAFEMAVVGLMAIAAQHPEDVNIKVTEV